MAMSQHVKNKQATIIRMAKNVSRIRTKEGNTPCSGHYANKM